MTDLLTRLTEARPTDSELDAMWSPAARTARLSTLRPAARRHRGRRTALLAAAAAVAAFVVVPGVVDSGDATAADLRALAGSAVRYDGPVLTQGRWLHERSTSVQRNTASSGESPRYVNERETWTSWDGVVYLVNVSPLRGLTEWDLLDERSPATYQRPTPQFSATLPDDADGLLAYLDGRVFGSSSHDEAMFEALTGLATSHTLPPATLGAAFEALAEIDDVSTADRSVDGRPAVEIRYDEALTSSSRTIVVDRATGQVLSAREVSEQGSYVSTTALSEVVDGVPADVLADFETHGDGGFVCADAATCPRR